MLVLSYTRKTWYPWDKNLYSKFTYYGHIHISKKKHGTLGPFKIKRSLFTASSHVCIDVFLNLSTCMDRSM